MAESSFRWRILPVALRLLFPKPKVGASAKIRSVVCLRPGKLGDMIVATPLFSALKKEGGVERLAVVCCDRNEIVIKHNPFVDERKVVNFHRIDAVLSAIGWLRRQGFDALVDLTPGFSRTNFFMAFYAGARTIRVGIEKEHIADRYHFHSSGSGHLADRILDAGEKLTEATFARPRRFELYAAADEVAAAARFAGRCGGRIIGINLSAGNGERQWPYDRFAALAGLLAAKCTDATIALIAIGEQRPWAERLAAEIGSCVAVPALPFLAATEFIGRCSLLVSADTALIHAAGARGVPVVGLYTENRENTLRWGPYNIPHEVIHSSSAHSIEPILPAAVGDAAVRLLAGIGGMERGV
jgi:ADP-heptose:LPS heptosyltransferase